MPEQIHQQPHALRKPQHVQVPFESHRNDPAQAKRPKTAQAAATLELRASGIEPVDSYPGLTSIPFHVRCLTPKCRGHTEPFETYLSVVRALRAKGDSGLSI
jgi:hypothetical protein